MTKLVQKEKKNATLPLCSASFKIQEEYLSSVKVLVSLFFCRKRREDKIERKIGAFEKYKPTH